MACQNCLMSLMLEMNRASHHAEALIGTLKDFKRSISFEEFEGKIDEIKKECYSALIKTINTKCDECPKGE